MLTRTEQARRFGIQLTIDDEVLDDGPAMVAVLEKAKARFDRMLAEQHLVTTSALRMDEDYDATRGQMQVRLSALVVRDPDWVRGIWAEAQAAVEEDARWFAGQRT